MGTETKRIGSGSLPVFKKRNIYILGDASELLCDTGQMLVNVNVNKNDCKQAGVRMCTDLQSVLINRGRLSSR